MNISYLYNGDIISSCDSQYSEIKNSPLTSPSFIINSIVNIYKESFNVAFNKSKEFIIPLESISDSKNLNIFDKISELDINSIQSLVYSIQNMDYTIESVNDDNIEWKHTITYNLYDCKFNSYKLSIRDVSKLRIDKINKILDGN